ncbi:AAA family ATPase [Psychromonas sp. KJ10-10]|uniref:AAA family ATPase n=1 Tax=Psychromonas sp. KJ10-10 TaxID=3391823 RepID=UPI0039B5256E
MDEASMVDLPLMAKLLMALPEHARLILLGDKDQLASVEAGAVLGDICAFINSGYSQEKATQLAQLTGFDSLLTVTSPSRNNTNMSDKLCLLRKSYRFDQYSGIGFLAMAINQGKASFQQIQALFNKYQDLSHYANNESSHDLLSKMIVAGYAPYLKQIQKIDADNRELPKKLLKLLVSLNCYVLFERVSGE